MTYTLEDVRAHIDRPFEVSGNTALTFSSFAPITEATTSSMAWIRAGHPEAAALLADSPAAFIICAHLDASDDALRTKCLIHVDRPDLVFSRLVKRSCTTPARPEPRIHPTAIVDPRARLGNDVIVGAYATVGACTIGNGSTIKAHATVHDGAELGANVLISEYCNIGGQGFGHIRDDHGNLENMLHAGKVIIEDDVEIFPYTNVDRATLSVTRVGRGSKIDHYYHIGHNTRIGERTVITANTTLAGGAVVGSDCFVGVGSLIRERVRVGDAASVGIGSVVTKDVPPGETWAGVPARPLGELKTVQEALRLLVHGAQSDR